MKRRNLLKVAALTAVAKTTGAFAMDSPGSIATEPPQQEPIGKIALEEHFMVPDFIGYFAETYPNISPFIKFRITNKIPIQLT